MSGIISGYNYDIFISYRQKDNKGDRWVSDFVEALKVELESTFKEDISIYFDINPHDGLLETHDVNASLKEKLKCLIFIPIISQTYCDSKSFAWQHEFTAFNKMAKDDQFGRDIKLSSGNVASRILPVKIHELDAEDKTLLENELGGVLRNIEFIYKSSGVNRPLRANEDHPQDNLNKTYYRDQINKIANAAKEIITAIKKLNQQDGDVLNPYIKAKPAAQKNLKPKIIIASVVLLAILAPGYFFIPKLFKSSKPVEKSIAVLPFINDSPDNENAYFINGVMDEILNNLQKIRDFRVLSRTSTEQYRGSTKYSLTEIAKKLNVNYIVEGSGQKYGNKFVLRVQLIAADNEKHLWGQSYDQVLHETSDIINIQSQIAQAIASELKARITPEEKQLIEKTPTVNLTAYDFYQRGRDEYTKYWLNARDKAALQKAVDLYHKALDYDSTFAQAYTGLARVYGDTHFSREYFNENVGDSVLILTDIALSFDNQVAEAYNLKGLYYFQTGNPEQAIKEYETAIKLNPNDWMAYYWMGSFYYGGGDELVKSIENLQKAASLNHGPELPRILRQISYAYFNSGFLEKSNYYRYEALKLDFDSVEYYNYLAGLEDQKTDFLKANVYWRKAYAFDSTILGTSLAESYMKLGQYEELLNYYKKWIERLKALGLMAITDMHRIGYAYWQNGFKKEADYYFDKQIEYSNNQIKLKRPRSKRLYIYYDLAGIYAFRGEKNKAYENLKIFNQRQKMSLSMLNLIKTDPLFNSIRNEPEFQKIVRDVEAKYQAEHERVRKWLEEQGML
jgi:TolB-like protein